MTKAESSVESKLLKKKRFINLECSMVYRYSSRADGSLRFVVYGSQSSSSNANNLRKLSGSA